MAVVRQCTTPCDIEVMGVVCSWLALGNRNQIYKHCRRSYEMMAAEPYRYVMGDDWRKFERDERCYYRMFRYSDFYCLMSSLNSVYRKYATLEDGVLDYLANHTGADYLDALIALLPAKGIPAAKSSACKRLCLFLRWMVRRDATVDLGIWRRLDPSKLLIPLDVHVCRIGRELGLLTRKQADMKAAIQLTDRCRLIIPSDPCALDYALFGYGYTTTHSYSS